MPSSWWEAVQIYRDALTVAAHTDFAQVRYDSVATASWLAAAAAATLLFTAARLAYLRRRHSRAHSGFAVDRRMQRRFFVRLLHGAPIVLATAAVGLLVIAAADPYLTTTEETTGSVESRTRIDLVDVSGSMAWEMLDTGKSKAEIARDAHLRFLTMRRGKSDRVSLWLFSTYPYQVDDFVIDDDLYYFLVDDAPYVISSIIDRTMVVPRDKVRIIPAEGSSNITRPLQAIVRHFDQDDAATPGAALPKRALLIITDAAVDEFSEASFQELNRRQVVPYMIHINTSPPQPDLPEPALVQTIRNYGGDHFDVRDEDSLMRAYQAIDEREAVRVEITRRAYKVPIFQRFLVVALTLFAVAVPIGTLGELVWGTYP
jgi:hypothetical protein